MKNLKETVEVKLEQEKMTKKHIYSTIGMTKAGFDAALKSESLSLKNFAIVADILAIEPNYFFEWETETDTSKRKSAIDTVSDIKEEIDFLRGQIKELTRQNGQLIEILKRG